MDVRILDFASLRRGEGPLAVLVSDALSRAGPATGRVRALDAYASVIPVAASSGEPVALLRTVLPSEAVTGMVLAMERRMLAIGSIVALLATALAVLIGRYWTSDIRHLTAAARRIGRGDLTVSIADAGTGEVGLLASTMEEMRQNLIELTREIRRREAQAQAVLGGIVEGVYAVDKKRRIRYLNRQAEVLLGVSAEQALGRFCGDVLKPTPDADGRLPCSHACPIVAAREGNSVDAVELIEPQPARRRRVVIASAPSGDGMQVQVLRDETELEAVRRTRDTVLANISHEFRTPLSAQLASIELLREGLGNLPLGAQTELVASLERGAHRLTWLIDNLLESVRIESGQLTIRHQSVSIDEVAAAARELVEPLLTQRGQRLALESLARLLPIQGDRQRLIQVMVNLLANASKFSPPDSVIRIGGDMPDGDTVVFWVEDEGPGPADPTDTALFDRFHRAGGEDPDESGLGLGLYIVRSIIERHGGEVALFRTPEGRTRAAATLPIGQAA
jgi:signal transduction histidine kinase/HAMP domain-containing protein